MDEIIENIISLNEGRLTSYDVQAVLIDRMLVDYEGDILSDDDGNILTE